MLQTSNLTVSVGYHVLQLVGVWFKGLGWAKNIYFLALYGKRLPTPGLKYVAAGCWHETANYAPDQLLTLHGRISGCSSSSPHWDLLLGFTPCCGQQSGLLVLFVCTFQLTKLSQNPHDSVMLKGRVL